MKRLVSSFLCLLALMAITVPVFADPDYSGYRGYRESPYDRHRHYDHQRHRGHNYTYRGHWRSWNNWDDYARVHMHFWVQDHGGYYRDGDHLMFRSCEPDASACFYFSIGR